MYILILLAEDAEAVRDKASVCYVHVWMFRKEHLQFLISRVKKPNFLLSFSFSLLQTFSFETLDNALYKTKPHVAVGNQLNT